MSDVRWIRVTVTYRSGTRVDDWPVVDLGETSMLQEIDGTDIDLGDLAVSVKEAATELIARGELLTPRKPEEPRAAVFVG